MTLDDVLAKLHSLANPKVVNDKNKKFGIRASNSLGIYQKDLKELARRIGFDDELAIQLYATGIYEARLLVPRIYRPANISKSQMNTWVAGFENWEICDSYCMGFFAKSDYAAEKALHWSTKNKEFTKRAGFAIMAAYGFAHKNDGNSVFLNFLAAIEQTMERQANDERIYVKKAVNWALRSIGKRNVDLRQHAILTANKILKSNSKAAQWIAKDALKELQSSDVKIQDYPRTVYRPG